MRIRSGTPGMGKWITGWKLRKKSLVDISFKVRGQNAEPAKVLDMLQLVGILLVGVAVTRIAHILRLPVSVSSSKKRGSNY